MSSIKLWPKQQEALEFALSRDNVALLCEQRTGKTYITMALLTHIMEDDGEPLCGVLTCLLNNKESTWVDKLTEFLPDLQLFTDLVKFRKAQGHRLLLVHFEQLSRIMPKLCKFKKLNWAGVDEGHRIANRSSKQSKAQARLSWVRRKLILTGTPIEKQPSNMWAQLRFLCPDVLGTRWSDFENEYMDFKKIDIEKYQPGTVTWQRMVLQQRILKSRASFDQSKLPKFIRLIKPHCIRVTQEDVGILDVRVTKVLVPLFGAQARCYHEMEDHSVTRTPQGMLVASPMEVTTIMKRRQLASGFVYDEEGSLEYVGGAKLRRLKRMVKDIPKPVVIFTAFKPDTDQIHQAMVDEGYETIKVSGGTKKSLRPDIWRDFQRAQYDVIVCQIRTGGVGVDLWKANTAIIHSMGHSFIDWDQAKARLSAKGKNKATQVYVLCAENTVDEELYQLVLVKGLTGSKVLNQLRK